MVQHAKHGHWAICDDTLDPELWMPANSAYLLYVDGSLPDNFCSKCIKKFYQGWVPAEGPEFIDP